MEDPFELSESEEEILRITVNIGGISAEIVVHADDEPLELAKQFAIEHDLSSEKLQKLAAHIENCIKSLVDEETQSKTDRKSMQSSTQSVRNKGEELYKKGMEYKSKRVSQIQQEKIKEMAKEAEELTFHPNITSYTPRSNLNSAKDPIKRTSPPRPEEQNCTFKPKLNSRTEKLASAKSHKNIPIHEVLYSQAKIIELKKKQLENK